MKEPVSKESTSEFFDLDLEEDLLQELENQTAEEIGKARQYERFDLKLSLVLQPANSSEVMSLKVRGTTSDLSGGGCGALFPVPIAVGDIFRLEFDRKQLDLPLVFARCLRCRLIREDAFEAGFRFFTPITLPGTPAGKEKRKLFE